MDAELPPEYFLSYLIEMTHLDHMSISIPLDWSISRVSSLGGSLKTGFIIRESRTSILGRVPNAKATDCYLMCYHLCFCY